MNNNPIGTEIMASLEQWDHEAHKDRMHSEEAMHPSLKKVKYQSIQEAYLGLSRFYKEVSSREESEGFYRNHTRANYLYAWTLGEYRMMRYGVFANIPELCSRYLTGYGLRPARPLAAWLLNNMLFSVLYLLSGISHNGTTIHRMVGISGKETVGTLHDLAICLYFSTITSTTVGYGDIAPRPGWSMFFCGIHAILGILLMTLFTVVLAKRFFK